jgi:serine/threonine protein kinase
VLDKRLGQGAFSEVWRANNRKTGEAAAVKVSKITITKVRGKPVENQEARLLSKERTIYATGLRSHPNIPKLSKPPYGNCNGWRFLAIQLLGQSVGSLLDANATGIDPALVVRIGIDAAAALAYVHQRGYVYVDMKPDNLMFAHQTETNPERVYLCDFGAAVRSSTYQGTAPEGRGDGTPEFQSLFAHAMSPTSPRDDLLGLVYVLFKCLRGSLPWSKATSAANLVETKEATRWDALSDGSQLGEALVQLGEIGSRLGVGEAVPWEQVQHLLGQAQSTTADSRVKTSKRSARRKVGGGGGATSRRAKVDRNKRETTAPKRASGTKASRRHDTVGKAREHEPSTPVKLGKRKTGGSDTAADSGELGSFSSPNGRRTRRLRRPVTHFDPSVGH